MAGRVDGKVVLLTGGAMGLGKASAKALLAQGARVIITDINADAGTATAAELGCDFLPQDVTDWARWQAIIAQVEAMQRTARCAGQQRRDHGVRFGDGHQPRGFPALLHGGRRFDLHGLQGGDPADGQKWRRVDRQFLQRGWQTSPRPIWPPITAPRRRSRC